MSVPTDFFRTAWYRTTHGTKDTSGQRITGKTCQQFPTTCIDRNVPHTGNDVGRIAFDMFPFAKQSERLITCIECYTDNFRTLGNKDSLLGIHPITQLGICQGSEHFHSGVFQRCYFDDRHESLLFPPKLRKKTRPNNDFFFLPSPINK